MWVDPRLRSSVALGGCVLREVQDKASRLESSDAPESVDCDLRSLVSRDPTGVLFLQAELSALESTIPAGVDPIGCRLRNPLLEPNTVASAPAME